MENIVLNKIPSQTWSWLKMNKAQVQIEESFSEKAISFTPASGIKFTTEKNTVCEENFQPAKNFTACDRPLLEKLNSVCKVQNTITVSGKISEPVVINMNWENGENSASVQKIIAEPDSESTFIFVYTSEKDACGQSLIHTHVVAKENASVKIVKVQLLGKNFLQADNTSYTALENASVKLTQIQLGAKELYSSVHANLTEHKSNLFTETAYFCHDEMNYDFNHICYQQGKKTDCKMYVNGTLTDKAKKTYRGTIDFKNGCSGSTGDEQEQVLLLSPEAVNNSIPVILCDEEDVAGEHGATIGRLSDDIMFYMQSHSIDEETAKKIMARAKIQNLINQIKNEKVVEQVCEFTDYLFGEN